jgi:hypothetical protein
MGFGLWKKIKEGFKKAGTWIRDKVVKPAYEKVIKPVGKVLGSIVAPIAKAVAPVAMSINPAIGAAVAGVGMGADMIGRVTQNPKDELQPLLKEGVRRLSR